MRISDWSSDVCSSDLAGEIEVELQAVGEGAAPGLEEVERCAAFGSGEDRAGHRRQAVGDDDLLEQADGEDGDADGQVVGARPEGARLGELRQPLAVVDDGAGDELEMGREPWGERVCE